MDPQDPTSTLPPSTPETPKPSEATPEYAKDLTELAANYREQRQRQEAERAEAAKREALKPDLLVDLDTYLKETYGLNDQEVAAAIRNVVYKFDPEGPPVDLKLQLMELKQKRQEAERSRREVEQQVNVYISQLNAAVRTATESEFPASLDYYDGDSDRYVRALERTARSIAAQAEKDGVYADLSPRAVQAVLEKALDARTEKLVTKRSARKSPKKPDEPTNAEIKAVVAAQAEKAEPTNEKPKSTGPLSRAEADRLVLELL